jgi:hypothetical protein
VPAFVLARNRRLAEKEGDETCFIYLERQHLSHFVITEVAAASGLRPQFPHPMRQLKTS